MLDIPAVWMDVKRMGLTSDEEGERDPNWWIEHQDKSEFAMADD